MGTAWGAPPTLRKHWNKTQEVAHSGTQRKALGMVQRLMATKVFPLFFPYKIASAPDITCKGLLYG